ncbi:hypothetical protein Y032_0037g3440 [Ancylostoma ceylanicum]|uniref:AB hydrolase-1 domain-containing protein n=1 Tax=Ancylostoma ceylanicum TaxID=53326 RepID=A0A016UL98_9BILA|nr:hypothetical protein Y032_0037g3440 [Ancylostoma ceylanicum]
MPRIDGPITTCSLSAKTDCASYPLWSFGKWVVRRRHLSTKRVYDAKAGLFSVPVQFRNNKGDLIKLDAVYQDSMPEGGQRATIFAVHGAPGTHADFKYLVSQLRNNNVRMIMPNFPGLGFTPSDPRLCCENEERNEFAQAVLDSVENLGTTDLIFMGHSRGGENALQIATSEQNVQKTRGIVMLNAAGLRIHRGIQPYWTIDYCVRLLDLEVFNFILQPFLYFESFRRAEPTTRARRVPLVRAVRRPRSAVRGHRSLESDSGMRGQNVQKGKRLGPPDQYRSAAGLFITTTFQTIKKTA